MFVIVLEFPLIKNIHEESSPLHATKTTLLLVFLRRRIVFYCNNGLLGGLDHRIQFWKVSTLVKIKTEQQTEERRKKKEHRNKDKDKEPR